MKGARLLAAGGCLAFLACCSLPWVGLFNPNGVADTGLYSLYGQRMADGLVPYRDFFVEFPPGALPALVVPALPGAHYVAWFHAVEFVLGLGTMVCLAAIVSRTVASRRGRYGAIALAAVAPAVLGPITLNSFDYWPTFLTAASVAALTAGRHKTGFAGLGAATASKLFPAGLLALALLVVLRRDGRTAWRVPLAVYAATVVAIFAPFAALGPGGLRYSLRIQLGRGLQLESLGASFFTIAHHLGRYHPAYAANLAYAQLSGSAASLVADLSTLVMVVAIALVAWLYWRGPGDDPDVVLAATATLAGIVAFAKVLSPQYLIWLVPLVAAAAPRVRLAAPLFLLALGLTQVWVPDRFRELQAMDWVTWVVVARNLTLVGVFALLASALRDRLPTGEGTATRRARARVRPGG